MSRAHRLRLPAGIAFAAVLTVLLSGCSRPSQAPLPELGAGSEVEGPLESGVRAFRLRLAAGDSLEIATEQRGADLVVALLDPEGETVAEVDSPIGDLGEETLVALARTSGEHRLELRVLGASRGASFALTVKALRPASPEDRTRAEGFEIFARGERERRGRAPRAAQTRYLEALERFRAVHDGRWIAETRLRLGMVAGDLGAQRRAARWFGRAAARFAAAGDRHREGIARDRLGVVMLDLGEVEAARSSLERALELRRVSGNRRGEIVTSSNLGRVCQLQGQVQTAYEHHRQALELARALGDRRFEAQALHNLGDFYRSFGSAERARDVLEQAAVIFAELGEPARQAATLDQLGQLDNESGDHPRALRHFERALELFELAGEPRGHATALANLAHTRRRLGELDAAAEGYRRALDVFARLGEPRSQAQVLQNLGSIATARGDLDAALEHHQQALAIFRRLPDPAGEAGVLTALAAALRRRGQLGAAREQLASALTLSESLRRGALSHALRSSYLAALEERYDAWVDLLMASHAREPAAGFDRRAFEASERARARSLLEQLEEAAAGHGRGVDPELRVREQRIAAQLNAAGERYRRLAEGGSDGSGSGVGAPRLERTLRRLGEDLEAVRAQLRVGRGGALAWVDPEPLDLDAVQHGLLDAGSQLLVFDLGPERSWVWRVTSSSFASFELAPEAEITAAARRAHELLARSHRRESAAAAQMALCRLGTELLAPLGGLDARRLLVVAEGALEAIPFAALPEPGTAEGCAAPPLLARREVVGLPSVSVAAALRRRLAARPLPKGALVVVADPVFAGGSEFSSLRFARREAEAILAAAPAVGGRALLDFEASKEQILAGALADYRLVHFATHGRLDSEHPELSALALAELDAAGRPRDGLLRAHEVPGLDLAAETVVLSGCRTALGRELRGEGIVGLPRAFLFAGAARVVVSLWNVGDLAVAELMGRFYRHVLGEGQSPAAALRRAQLETRADPRWRAPYFWAAFVIQGEWP